MDARSKIIQLLESIGYSTKEAIEYAELTITKFGTNKLQTKTYVVFENTVSTLLRSVAFRIDFVEYWYSKDIRVKSSDQCGILVTIIG